MHWLLQSYVAQHKWEPSILCVLQMIVLLYNFRDSKVGQDQSASVYSMPY
jgi:hypothetical protein